MIGKKISVFIFKIGMTIALVGLITNSINESFTFNNWMIIGFTLAGVGSVCETYFYFKIRKHRNSNYI